jgi:hypothetical protein
MLARVGDDDGQHVARIARAPPDGNHHRPVAVDDPHPQLSGDVCCGEDAHDAGGTGRTAGVDGENIGARMRSEVQRGVQHAGHGHVVDVVAVAQCQFAGFVLRAGTSDAGGQCRFELFALGNGVDGFEDLDVAGAPAQVSTEMAGHVGRIEFGTLLVDLRLGAHDDAGNAEPALQSATRRERVGEGLTFGCRHSFQGHHRSSSGLGEGLLAADDGLAVDVHRATSALAGWRAAVLRRGDTEFFTQRGEQVRMILTDAHRGAVQRELDRHALHFVMPSVSSHQNRRESR